MNFFTHKKFQACNENLNEKRWKKKKKRKKEQGLNFLTRKKYQACNENLLLVNHGIRWMQNTLDQCRTHGTKLRSRSFVSRNGTSDLPGGLQSLYKNQESLYSTVCTISN